MRKMRKTAAGILALCLLAPAFFVFASANGGVIMEFNNSGLVLEEEDFAIAVITNTSRIAPEKDKMLAVTGWILDNRDRENIKLVLHPGSLVAGEISSGYWKTGPLIADILGSPAYSGLNYSAYLLYLLSAGRLKANGAYDRSLTEQGKNAAEAFALLSGAGIPYGFSTYPIENLGGYIRSTVAGEYFDIDFFGASGYYTGVLESAITKQTIQSAAAKNSVDAILNAGHAASAEEVYGMTPDIYSYENSYYIVRSGGSEYLVLSLEAFPREAVRRWASDLIAANPDRRAIVSLSSMLDGSGEFIQCWNSNKPTNAGYQDGVVTADYYKTSLSGKAVNTRVRSYNMANFGDPLDGSELWRLMLQKHANLMLVIDGGYRTATGANTADVKIRQQTGVNGNRVFIVQSRFDAAMGTSGGVVTLIRFRQKGKWLEVIPVAVNSNMYFADYNYSFSYPTYRIDTADGTVQAQNTALAGEKVSLTLPVPAGKKVKEGSVKLFYQTSGSFFTELPGAFAYLTDYQADTARTLRADRNGKYRFVMPAGNVLIGGAEWIDESALNFTLSSGSVRTDGALGMRFLATVRQDGADTSYARLWEYGILAAPTRLLTDPALQLRFTDGAADGLLLDIPMFQYYQYEISSRTGRGYFCYTGVISGIPDGEINTPVSAVAYVKYTFDGVHFSYAYSEVLEKTCGELAEAAFFGGRESYDAQFPLAELVRRANG